MNINGIIVITTLLFATNTTFAQKIHKSNVPSIIINAFHQYFPRTNDVKWKMDQENYKVEFESGLHKYDHTAWFDKSGTMVRHIEEISKGKLPEGVSKKVASEFAGYRIDEIKKISERNSTIYSLELIKEDKEWKVSFDSQGKILNKKLD